VDSDGPAAFSEVDQLNLERLCRRLGLQFAETVIV
jgi:putative methionine-R-sulfoxide reductase with GAF domain